MCLFIIPLLHCAPLSADTDGLAVIEKSATSFKVKKLRNGAGNFAFDWEVKSVRKGYENFKVVKDKEVDPKIVIPTEIPIGQN